MAEESQELPKEKRRWCPDLSSYFKFKCSKRKEKKKYDPYFFQENNSAYRVLFGLFHVKVLTVLLCLLKTIALFVIIVRKISLSESGLTNIACIFIFFAASLSYVLVIVGVQTKRYTFIIPYFTVCVLVILLLVMQLFMDFLETANKKDTLEWRSLGRNLTMFLLIVFEVYTLLVVWKAFVYINDYQMHTELYSREKRERLNSLFIRKCSGLAYHPFKNHLITIREESEDEEVPVFAVK